MNKKKIYIASPYTVGDQIENTRVQLDTFNLLISLGYTPFAPLWTALQHLVYPLTWETWMQWDLAWLKCCDAVLRLPGESRGADVEVETAIKHGIPVLYSLEELKTHTFQETKLDGCVNEAIRLLEYELAEQELLMAESSLLLEKFLSLKDEK